MPTIYAIPLALILKYLAVDMTKAPFWPAFEFIRQGLISVALITLGVQLSRTSFNFKDREVYLAVAMRLIGGPIFSSHLTKIIWRSRNFSSSIDDFVFSTNIG